jgi:hypothetical protein
MTHVTPTYVRWLGLIGTPWMSRTASAMTPGPPSIARPEPLNTRPSMSIDTGRVSSSPVNEHRVYLQRGRKKNKKQSNFQVSKHVAISTLSNSTIIISPVSILAWLGMESKSSESIPCIEPGERTKLCVDARGALKHLDDGPLAMHLENLRTVQSFSERGIKYKYTFFYILK